MATVRVFKDQNRLSVTMLGVTTVTGGSVSLMVFGLTLELNPMVALIGICATAVWLLVGMITWLILATEPIKD